MFIEIFLTWNSTNSGDLMVDVLPYYSYDELIVQKNVS